MRNDLDIFDRENNDSSGLTLKNKYKLSWTEESFTFDKETGKQPTSIHTKKFLGKSIVNKKTTLFVFLIIIFLTTILLRVFFIQIIKNNHYAQLAENNRVRIKPIISERGILFDKNGIQLVQNDPSFSLAIIPQDLPSKQEQKNGIIQKLSQIVGISEEEIDNLIKKYKNYRYESIVLKENLDYATALKLYIENANMPGVIVEGTTKRHYTQKKYNDEDLLSASHIIGYIGKLNDKELENLKKDKYLISDNIGKIGIEKKYESELRGQYGEKKVEVNASGLEQNVIAEKPPTPGNNIFLTIDLNAQYQLEKIIKNFSERTGKQRIGAVAMNPQNGEVVAMVSWPTFNNNDFIGGISKEKYQEYSNNSNAPLFNRVISGSYPSGSIIKLIIAAAGLEEKIITPNTNIYSSGGLQISKWLFKDWKVGGHGYTNLNKAIAWSVNTYFYMVGGGYDAFKGLGVDNLIKYMKKFGLSEKTGIDLPAENDGFLPSEEWKKITKHEQWYIGDTYNLSIGQGDLLVTPIQAAVWTSAIANGGKKITPHLVSRIIDSQTKQKKELGLNTNSVQIISQENASLVKRAAKECVMNGSCGMLRTLRISSGGKTGTAQWHSTKETHGWFTAFAPYENPQIVVTAIVEEGGEGAYSAMPIVYNFLNWWQNYHLTQ